MRKKVRTIVREDWGWGTVGWSPVITIVLKSGKKLVREQAHAKGQPPDLLRFEDVIEKYKTCVEPVLANQHIKQSVKMILELQDVRDISEIIEEVAF